MDKGEVQYESKSASKMLLFVCCCLVRHRVSRIHFGIKVGLEVGIEVGIDTPTETASTDRS